MKYYVVEAESKTALMVEVNKLINQGWQLQGGVCRDRYWYQALVKSIKE